MEKAVSIFNISTTGRILRYVTLFITYWCLMPVSAQMTAAYEEPRVTLERADELYASGHFDQAHQTYSELSEMLQFIQEPSNDPMLQRAEFGMAKSAMKGNDPLGEKLMLDFITHARPEPRAIEATMELAGHYYNGGDYERAAGFYAMLRTTELDAETLSEARFKQGYSYFVRKDFTQAELTLAEVREIKSVYYYPVNYYYGMCQFFRNDFAGASESFERVAQSEKYKDFVPYYITQMHFAQGDYAKVLLYAEPRLQYDGVRNKDEIRLLLGRAYFEQGDFVKARPYLEAYAKEDLPMRAEDFYQLAFVQYNAGDLEAAIGNFRQVASQNDSLGQRANFYLADCYVRTVDLQSARTAFRNASKMPFDRILADEALLQYGKVSAQLHYDAEAIQALDAIATGSPHYTEAQEVLSNLFAQTRDYEKAAGILESFQQLSPALKKAYQEVSLNLGMQQLLDGEITEAEAAFRQVDKYPVDQGISAQALFWRAEIAHREESYDRSAELLRQYFTLAKTSSALPVESSPALAHYMQGYNALQVNNYIQAQGQFTDAISLLKKNQQQYDQAGLRSVLPDAMVRAGDCAFKRSQYAEARRLYEDAIPTGGPHMVYAKYQVAMIAGLTRNPSEKIRILENLGIDHPESQFADDALLQLGITYQDTGNDEKAQSSLQKLLEKYPASDLYVPALIRLGLINYNAGHTQTALGYYKDVFKYKPTPDQGREALSAIEEIYVRDLGTPDAYFAFVSTVPGYELSALKKDSVSYRVAEIQYEQGSYPAAVKSFTDYLRQFPNGVNLISAHFYRGDANVLLEKYTEALEDFTFVANRGFSPFYTDALRKAAVISYNHARDFPGAFEHYRNLTEALTDPALRLEAELGAVRSAYRAGMVSEVVSWQDRILANPAADAAARGEAAFYTGKASMDQKDYEHATRAFRRVTELLQNTQAAEARFRLAQISFFRGDLDQAEQLAHEANEMNATYPYWVAKSLILISDVYVERKDLFNAKAPLEAVIENFDGDSVIRQEAQEKLDAIRTMEAQQSRIHRDTSQTLDLIDDNQNK